MTYTTIVKESEWCRGQQDSALLLDNGTKCCLGFDALRRGFAEEEIFLKTTPEALGYGDKRLVGLVNDADDEYGERTHDTSVVTDIVRVNDSTVMTDEERKQKLIELFAKLDTELVFVP